MFGSFDNPFCALFVVIVIVICVYACVGFNKRYIYNEYIKCSEMLKDVENVCSFSEEDSMKIYECKKLVCRR